MALKNSLAKDFITRAMRGLVANELPDEPFSDRLQPPSKIANAPIVLRTEVSTKRREFSSTMKVSSRLDRFQVFSARAWWQRWPVIAISSNHHRVRGQARKFSFPEELFGFPAS